MSDYIDCGDCRCELGEYERRHGLSLCERCADQREREEAEAQAAEYDDARWELARDYGYEHP